MKLLSTSTSATRARLPTSARWPLLAGSKSSTLTAIVVMSALVVLTSVPCVSAQYEILHGNEVPTGQKTYTVGLRDSPGGASFCGGSLIAPTVVVTAAHCSEADTRYVSIGTHYLNGTTDGEQIAVKRQIVHPLYQSADTGHDVMLLELARASSFAPVRLVTPDHDVRRSQVTTVMGWGDTKEDGEQSDVLLELDVQVWDNAECQAALRKDKDQGVNASYVIDETMFCAGGKQGEDSCQGDSGGPIIVRASPSSSADPYDGDVLVGVVSWGVGCGRPNFPGVYHRLSTSLDFIYERVPVLLKQ